MAKPRAKREPTISQIFILGMAGALGCWCLATTFWPRPKLFEVVAFSPRAVVLPIPTGVIAPTRLAPEEQAVEADAAQARVVGDAAGPRAAFLIFQGTGSVAGVDPDTEAVALNAGHAPNVLKAAMDAGGAGSLPVPGGTEAAGPVVLWVVKPGQSLWGLARAAYGHGMGYTALYLANRDRIRDPRLIYPGQIFSVPGVAVPGH
jgi:nucleoid-associated protein YgaU